MTLSAFMKLMDATLKVSIVDNATEGEKISVSLDGARYGTFESIGQPSSGRSTPGWGNTFDGAAGDLIAEINKFNFVSLEAGKWIPLPKISTFQ